MITWSRRAVSAIQKLFEPLQEIDVYVEDRGDEVFYGHLLRRITDDKNRVVRVFARDDGRQGVISAASNHQPNGRRTLYLIDGDLDWVLGKPAPAIARLFRLPAYCIENLIVCECAAQRIIVEEAALSFEQAGRELRFAEWVESLTEALVELFAAFAVAREFIAAEATVAKGVARFYSTAAAGALPTLDVGKVNAERDALIARATDAANEAAVAALYEETLERALRLSFPLDVVSGKDFLLPLLDMHLRRCACRLTRKAMRMRLALHCDPERLKPLEAALRATE